MGLERTVTRIAWGMAVAAAMAATPVSAGSAEAKLEPRSGTKALLLEARGNGTLTPESFTGTTNWERGEIDGLPIIIGRALFRFQGMAATLRIRLNEDMTLPASHILEVDFAVAKSFHGGTVAGMPGVTFKDEALEQGTPIIGASARVMANSFIFAVSETADEDDAGARQLIEHDFIDLPIIYETGMRAIVTFEKGEEATRLFRDVFAAWGDPFRQPVTVARSGS
jgi:hypothetical protein